MRSDFRNQVLGAVGTLILIALLARWGSRERVPTSVSPSTGRHYVVEKLPPLPWHLVDVELEGGRAGTFQEAVAEVELLNDFTDFANVYVSPFNTYLNGHLTYAGLMSNVPPSMKADGSLIYNIGRGGIFSRWDVKTPDWIRKHPEGYLFYGDHEGDHVSVRRGFHAWAGRYIVRLKVLERVPGEPPSTWVGASVHTPGWDSQTVELGALRFPGETISLHDWVCAFVEVYGDANLLPERVPEMCIAFGNFTVDGRPLAPKHVVATFTPGVPNLASVYTPQEFIKIRPDAAGRIPDSPGSFVVKAGRDQPPRYSDRIVVYSAP